MATSRRRVGVIGAKSGGGGGVVNDMTAPTVPTALTATVNSSTQITLSWSASTDTAPTGVTPSGLNHYNIYRGGTILGTSVGTSFIDSGLTPSTTYSYQVSATDNNSNESALSTAALATTSAAVTTDAVAPSVPTGLTVGVATSTQITLSWSASTDSAPAGVTPSGMAGYKVYRTGSLVGQPVGTSFIDSGLTPSTTYSYQVSAYDNLGNESNLSTARSATTGASAGGGAIPPGCSPSSINVVGATDNLVTKINNNPTIDNFCLSGVMRLSSTLVIPRAVRIEAADATARITGSSVVTGWAASGSQWSATLPAGGPTTFDPVTVTTPISKYCEDIYLDGITLTKVGVKTGGAVIGAGITTVASGECFIDYDANKGYIGDAPSGRLLETNCGGITTLIGGGAGGVTWAGLVIGEALVHGLQSGNASTNPSFWTVDGCEVRNVHGDLARLGNNWKILNSEFHHGSEKGFAAGGNGSEVGYCDIHHCNFARYARGPALEAQWDAGTFKFTGTNNMDFHHNTVHDTQGMCWFDLKNANSKVRNNVFDGFAGNTDALIFEDGDNATVTNNTFRNNPRALAFHSNPNSTVTGNIIEGTSAMGIHMVDELNRLPTTNLTITGNTITMNGTSAAIFIRDTCTGHTINNNTYHLAGSGTTNHFSKCGTQQGFTAWKAGGYDTSGTADYH